MTAMARTADILELSYEAGEQLFISATIEM